MAKNNLKPVIHLQNNGYFDFTDPENSVYTIEDIARGLSRESRFNGHGSHFYSVAQHSVIISHIVPENLAMAGLLHDASEAFTKDIPKPLKLLLPGYVEIEQRVEAAIFKRFGLDFPMDKEIKVADIICFVSERKAFQPLAPIDKIYKSVIPMEQPIVAWSEKVAYNKFMARYKQLTKEKK